MSTLSCMALHLLNEFQRLDPESRQSLYTVAQRKVMVGWRCLPFRRVMTSDSGLKPNLFGPKLRTKMS